jgi:hypothetical protein
LPGVLILSRELLVDGVVSIEHSVDCLGVGDGLAVLVLAFAANDLEHTVQELLVLLLLSCQVAFYLGLLGDLGVVRVWHDLPADG